MIDSRVISCFKAGMDILLIHPPVVKPSEPPAGPARLAGALKEHGRSFKVVDANVEGLLYLLNGPVETKDTWTRRAFLHLEENLASLTDGRAFYNLDKYTQAVTGLNRVLSFKSAPQEAHVSLNNYVQDACSPVRSQDLIRASEDHEKNIFYPYFSRRLSGIMDKDAPSVVGFSLNYLSQAVTAFAMIGFMRRISPGTKIILGGGLVTSWISGRDWNNPFRGLVDELVAGKGEERILSLAGAEWSGVEPVPDYSPFQHYPYLSPGRVMPFSTSSGCYWGKCSFCPEQAEGSRYSPLSAGRAFSDFGHLASFGSPGLVHICDNALSPAFLKLMAGQEQKIPWYGFARVTHHLADPDFCAGLKRSGCVMLKLGIESFDQGVLDELGKGIRVEDSVKALRAIHASGIASYAYLLFGTPPEDQSAARKTLEFTAQHSDLIDFLNLSIFNLPRASSEACSLDTYDFSEGDLSLYQGFAHPKGWERNLVRRFLDKEFRRHPSIAGILRSDPPVFTSNHAPFFVMNRASERKNL